MLPFRDGTSGGGAGPGLAVAEAITASLNADGFGVLGPASTMPHSGSATDQLGAELGVDYVLSGTLDPREDSTIVFGQLVRVSDLEHVWADRLALPGDPAAAVGAAASHAAGFVGEYLAGRDTGRTTSGIAWERTGSGPAVVLVHGSNLDRRAWSEEARLLREHRTVVRYDLRAHGASAGAETPFSEVQDLADVMNAAEIQQADLVGLSAGARIALDFALEFPSRVRSLVLASPTVSGYRPPPEEQPSFPPELGRAFAAGDFDRAADLLVAMPIFEVPGPAGQVVATMVRENNRLWTTDPALSRSISPPAVDRLGDVTVPVLLLAGDDDLIAIRRQAELLARSLPNARLIWVEGGSHLLNLTEPRRFREAVFPFLGIEAPGN